MKRALAVWLIWLLGTFAMAHDLSLTLIAVDQETVTVKTPLSSFLSSAGLSGSPQAADMDLAVRVRLKADFESAAQLEVDSQADMLTWTGVLTTGSELAPQQFDAGNPTARTIFATYQHGAMVSEQVLDSTTRQPSGTGMLFTGIHHILSGLDHILFVVGLALLGGSWKSVLKMLSAFTLAHTLTLAAAAMGWIAISSKIVEPLIALSIVALAIEGIRKSRHPETDPAWIRIGIAFFFGLIHGLGFAGGLTDLGEKGASLVQNLVLFSVGIETGQIIVLLPCLALLLLAAKSGIEKHRQMTFASSVVLGMVGCFWLAERLF